MSKLTIIIPSRNEIFLQKTISDILEKAAGEIEVLAILDGYWPNKEKREFWSTPAFIEDARVKYVHIPRACGMRNGVNTGLKLASGEFIMKTDAHCMFAPGFDQTLSESCAENWLVIPRRYSLDAEGWTINKTRPVRDYHYLCFPQKGKAHDWGMHGVEWPQRGKERSDPKYDIDDNMSFQGSMWFAQRHYFMKHVGLLDDRKETYSSFAQEPQEIGLKYWLGEGEIKVNKKTWYAHLHKGRAYGRMYREDPNTVASHNWSAKHWMNNEEPGMIHPISWLVEKFWPVPTWPEDRSKWVSPI